MAVDALATAHPSRTQPLAQAVEDRLVELIYAAALDPALWPTAMAALADHVGGSLSIVTRLDAAAGGEVILSRSDPAWLDQYLTHFQAKNAFAPATRPEAFLRGFTGKVMVDSDCLAWEDYQDSEFFNDFMRPQGVNASLFVRLELTETRNSTLSIGRSLRTGRFERRDIDFALRMQPHLSRAYTLVRRLSGALSAGSDLAHALDSSVHALLVVDGAAAIRMMNQPAERLLAADKGLSAMGGRLVSTHQASARQLERLVAAATRSEGPRVGGAMSLPLPGRRFPLALRVAPMPPAKMAIFGQPHTALVCATDLERGVRSPEIELRALFGLTYAEARVATAIFEGLSMREAAEQLEVALNTVRFQLARVYEKTGVSRQAELVKMMMRLSSGLGES